MLPHSLLTLFLAGNRFGKRIRTGMLHLFLHHSWIVRVLNKRERDCGSEVVLAHGSPLAHDPTVRPQPTVLTVGTGTDGYPTVSTVSPSNSRYLSEETVKTVVKPQYTRPPTVETVGWHNTIIVDSLPPRTLRSYFASKLANSRYAPGTPAGSWRKKA